MKMRIAHLMATPQGKPGGLEKHTLDLCAELAKKHDVHLLADNGFAPHCAPTVHFHGVNFSRSRWNPLLYLDIAAQIRTIQPDILHAQAGKPALLWRNLRVFFPRVACVATQHGVQRNLRPYLGMDRVITVSAALAARYPGGRATVIHNGLQAAPVLDAESRNSLRAHWLAGRSGPLLVAVGRLDGVKGFDVLFNALRGIDATLLLVGDGGERVSLQALAQSPDLQRKVIFAGWRDDVPAILQCADLCVISSHSEGFSLVLAEALQAGTPVVSTRVGVTTEFLPAEQLVPPGDSAALHRVIAAALADLPALRARSEPAFARARDELTLAGMCARTEQLYGEMLHARRGAR